MTPLQLAYRTPDGLDPLVMTSDGQVLTGLHFADGPIPSGEPDLPVFRETCRWLDIYFSGRDPGFRPPYRLDGATPFRLEVLREVLAIPFGATDTYGAIAARLARRRGLARMSAQAVGQAVGWNPVCLVIPCHRIVGAGGAPTGYGGGLPNKLVLLRHEARGAAAR